MSSRSSTAATSARSARLAHGSRRPLTRAMSTHSRTVTGKLQLIVSTCGTYAIRRPGRRVTLPCADAHAARDDAQRRRLAGAGGPDDADELAAVDREVDVDEHGLAAVAAGDAGQAEQLLAVGARRGGHCG